MIEMYKFDRKKIDISQLRKDPHKLSSSLISPEKQDSREEEIAPDHAAEPIKKLEDINRIVDYLLEKERYRDYMLFIVGINFGLRASDLRLLRFSNLINDNLVFKDRFPVFEKKTRNTRKRKKNRYITINDAVIEAVTTYLEHTPGVCLGDYMFRSLSNKEKNETIPLSVYSIERILKGIAKDLDLNIHMSTHTLRKTFCYHQLLMSNNDNRKLLLLQKMLNHSSPMQTLAYIGITDDEISEAYKELNLGSTKDYMSGCEIIEFDPQMVLRGDEGCEYNRGTKVC